MLTERRRSGFTLTELLVVISIIGVLATLTVGGVWLATRGQQQSNTEAAMRNIQKALDQHWTHVVDEAKKEVGVASNTLSGADNDQDRARILWIKIRLMEAFPTRFSEISGAYSSSPLNLIPAKLRKYMATYKAAGLPTRNYSITGATNATPIVITATGHGLTGNTEIFVTGVAGNTAANGNWIANVVDPNNFSLKYGNGTDSVGNGPYKTGTGTWYTASESSACLLIALSANRGGLSFSADSLGSNVADSDGDGVREFVDNWNSPLAFCRFPTGNAELQGYNPATSSSPAKKYADPTDPRGSLFNWNAKSANRSTFESVVHAIASPSDSTKAAFVVPTIVSRGPNRALGLGPDLSIVNSNDADDNIYSFRLKLGARGD